MFYRWGLVHCAGSLWHGVCACVCVYMWVYRGVLGAPDGFYSHVLRVST